MPVVAGQGLVYPESMKDSSENPTEDSAWSNSKEEQTATEVLQPAEPALVAETDLDYVPISRTAAQSSVKRKTVLPICLFFATCLSTFWVGVSLWNPNFFEPFYRAISNPGVQQGSLLEIRQMLLSNWDTGLIYMLCVMLILFMHEMGHFIATLIYRVPASYPFFLWKQL